MSYPVNVSFGIAKLESVAGVAETITSADFNTRCRNIEVTFNIEVDGEGAKYARGDHAEDESVYGVRSAQIVVDLRLAWGGDETTEPDTWKFLNACGLKTVTYTGSGIALQPLQENDEKTLTFKQYLKSSGASPTAICNTFAGCAGNAVISCEKLGSPWYAKCTFQGKISGTSETIANASIPFPTDMDQLHPEKFLNNTIYIGGKPVKVSSFSLDFGNEIQPVYDQADPSGISHFAIVSRKPRFSCNPMMQALTEDDPIGDVVAGCTGLYAIDKIIVRSNRSRIVIPRAQMLPPSQANREGHMSWDKTYKCLNNGVSGLLGDTGLTPECTVEYSHGRHETGIAWTDTGMYM